MIQALNYIPKAIEALRQYPFMDQPWSRMGRDYLIAKLSQAQIFVLPEYGQLLDRSRPRPEVPELLFKPPFPVVALEYPAPASAAAQERGYWTASPCSKRIALAWDLVDDLPKALPWKNIFQDYEPGVVIAAVCWYDAQQLWMPVMAAVHIPYENAWKPRDHQSMAGFIADMIGTGRITAAQAKASVVSARYIPLFPEAMEKTAKALGADGMVEHVYADLLDEVNAYLDTVIALGCRNVQAVERLAPNFLNRQRIRKGKAPLKGFHVLEIDGEVMGAAGDGSSIRGGPRDHLRRGHIRRLGNGRLTWVNQTMVHGRGDFVGKAYAMRAVGND